MRGRVIRARGKNFIILADGQEYLCEVLKKAKSSVGQTACRLDELNVSNTRAFDLL